MWTKLAAEIEWCKKSLRAQQKNSMPYTRNVIILLHKFFALEIIL